MQTKKLLFMMFIFAGLILSACQTKTPTESPPGTPDGNVEYEYGQRATVESLQILLLESFPLQAQAIVSGTLPDGCTVLDEISVEQQDQTFILTLTTRQTVGDIACTEALVPFEETVPLDIYGLEAGTYQVIAQDKQSEFMLDVDNISLEQGGDTKYSYGQQAMVESMQVNLMESFPVQVSVTLSGNLPDGCTEIHEITAPREQQTFTISVITRKPMDVACTMALVPFEETISLDVEGLPAGDYTVQLGDLSETFTLEQDNEL